MKNKFLIGFAVVAALVLSGFLGKGDLLGIKTAFGYAGSSANRNVVVTPPSLTVQTPVNGASYAPAAVLSIGWTVADGAFVKYKVSYSTDSGASWNSISDNVTGNGYSWTVPNLSTTTASVKVEGYDYLGTLLASGTSSGNFTITGTVVPPTTTPPVVTPPVVTPAPAVDPTVHGSYTAAEAKANNPTFNDSKSLVPVASPACVSGTLIKGSMPAVYYCGADGKRYVFVNDKAYLSWYPDFSGVTTITDAALANITIGGNITYRPGTRMLKIVSDPKVYTVARGGILRWVETETAAARLFGANWNTMIDDVSDSFFVNYTVGDPIAY